MLKRTFYTVVYCFLNVLNKLSGIARREDVTIQRALFSIEQLVLAAKNPESHSHISRRQISKPSRRQHYLWPIRRQRQLSQSLEEHECVLYKIL